MASARAWIVFFTLAFLTQFPLPAAQAAQSSPRLTALENQCARGKNEACNELARFYRDSADTNQLDYQAAARLFKTACDRKHIQSCNDLGDMYYQGQGVERSTQIALMLYDGACQAGNAEACFSQALIYDRETVADFGDPRSAPLFEKACKSGYLDACSYHATKLLQGGDDYGALSVLGEACDKGNVDSCISLGTRYLWGNGVPKDVARGLAALEQGCAAGGGSACLRLAETYARGTEGLQPDEAKAALNFRRGCKAGDTYACMQHGYALYLGRGVRADPDAALRVFEAECARRDTTCQEAEAIRQVPTLRTECQQNNAASCLALGNALTRNDVLFKDLAGARLALEKACAGKLADGCLAAGDAHWNANPRNLDGTFRYFDEACQLGNSEGCFSLGLRLSGWPNIPEDEPRAATLFARACALGDKRACPERDRLAGLTPEVELADADAEYLPPPDDAEDQSEKPKRICRMEERVFNGQTIREKKCFVQITNGFAVKPGSVPWQALIERPLMFNGKPLSPTNRVLCGGSIIARGWILTAAHCLYSDSKDLKKDGYRVRTGFNDVTQEEGLSYPIIEVIEHPGFQRGDKTLANDMALVRYDVNAPRKMGELFPQRTIRIDTVPVGKRPIFGGMTAYAYGWGWTEATNSRASNILRGGKLALLTEPLCTTFTRFTGTLQNTVLCANGTNGQQACFGDSGGPLVYYGDQDGIPTLIGVVSAGKKCGEEGEPSRFTRVSHAASWIRTQLWARGVRQ